MAGAIFGGFGMVLQCMIPVREMYPGLKQIVTTRHLEVMAKFILLTGTLVGYAYALEFFIAWYGGSPYEGQTFMNRASGNYWWAYWIMVSCNLFIPQLLWFKSWRTVPWKLLIVVTFVNVGMWFERFVIIVQSLARDYLPSAWGEFYPSWVDWTQMLGDFGLFFTLTLLFIRFWPMIAMTEVKGILPSAHAHPIDPSHPPAGGAEAVTTGHGEVVVSHAQNGHGHHGHSRPRVIVPESELVTLAEGGKGRPYAMCVEFEGPSEILHAAKTMRDRGHKTLDAYTPYPVHGLTVGLGMTRSFIPWVTIAGSFTGFFTALIGQYFFSLYYYPIIVQGKEFGSWEAFTPICFEMTVLFSGLFTVGGLFLLCGFPKLFSPLDQYNRLGRATQDGFIMTLDLRGQSFDADKLRAEFAALGGYNIAVVED